MTDLDIPALRALGASDLTTGPLGSIAAGVSEDGDLLEWLALRGADGGYWWDTEGEDEDMATTARIALEGAKLVKVPVEIATLTALLDAAEQRDRLASQLAESGLTGAILRTALHVTLPHLPAAMGAEFQRLLSAPGNGGPGNA